MEYDAINNDLFTYANIMSKEGVVSTPVLKELQDSLKKYGPYELTLIASSYENNLQLSGLDLVNVNLRRAGYEKLVLSVKYKNPHIYGFFVNRNLFGKKISDSEIRLFGTVKTYIR